MDKKYCSASHTICIFLDFQLYARRILTKALSAGVKFCIQTRSPLVMNDFDLLIKYRNQIRLQISIATMNEKLTRIIEPRVALPRVRLDIIRKAKQQNLEVGVIIAPIFPPLKDRPDVREDLMSIMKELAEIKPESYLWRKSSHQRGKYKLSQKSSRRRHRRPIKI